MASLSVVAICHGLRVVCGATGCLADFGAEFMFSVEGSSASMEVVRRSPWLVEGKGIRFNIRSEKST